MSELQRIFRELIAERNVLESQIAAMTRRERVEEHGRNLSSRLEDLNRQIDEFEAVIRHKENDDAASRADEERVDQLYRIVFGDERMRHEGLLTAVEGLREVITKFNRRLEVLMVAFVAFVMLSGIGQIVLLVRLTP